MALRFTRVSKSFECGGRWQNFEGTVVSYREPFFRVEYDDGDTEDLEGKESVAKFAEAVFVLHCFQKKTQKTSREDIALATRRYADLLKELKP